MDGHFAGVAQLVRAPPVTPEVAGSSPVAPANTVIDCFFLALRLSRPYFICCYASI